MFTTASPILWTIAFTWAWRDERRDTNGKRTGASTARAFNFIGNVVPFYGAARVILLAIAFVSLRSLPSAAYETVYWTTFIPHV